MTGGGYEENRVRKEVYEGDEVRKAGDEGHGVREGGGDCCVCQEGATMMMDRCGTNCPCPKAANGRQCVSMRALESDQAPRQRIEEHSFDNLDSQSSSMLLMRVL